MTEILTSEVVDCKEVALLVAKQAIAKSFASFSMDAPQAQQIHEENCIQVPAIAMYNLGQTVSTTDLDFFAVEYVVLIYGGPPTLRDANLTPATPTITFSFGVIGGTTKALTMDYPMDNTVIYASFDVPTMVFGDNTRQLDYAMGDTGYYLDITVLTLAFMMSVRYSPMQITITTTSKNDISCFGLSIVFSSLLLFLATILLAIKSRA